MSTTIKSPVTDFTGPARFGTLVLDFKKGEATHDGDLPDGVKAYLQGAGYGINAEADEPASAPEPPDPRVQGQEQVGTHLRDAAVDPSEEDFLAPTNAGQANPHGPDVVSPEIHASEGVRPVKPGDVHVDDTDAQDAEETAHAEQDTFEATAPAGNASRTDWEAYALTQGRSNEELAGLSRDQIRDLFATE